MFPRLSRLLVTVLFLALAVSAAAKDSTEGSLSEADRQAIQSLRKGYNSAWVAGDHKAVLKSFAKDALLIPDHTPGVRGPAAIKNHFWPADGPAAKVTVFTSESLGVHGNSQMAYDHGNYTLTFVLDGQSEPFTSRGEYVAIANKQSDGSWLWALYTWNAHR